MDRHQVVRLPPGLRESPPQKLIKGLQFLQPPVQPGLHFAQLMRSEFTVGARLPEVEDWAQNCIGI